MKIISIEKSFGKYKFIDTRSPKEFEIDNIPGSVNIPIFSDEERHDIGLLYKQNNDEGIKLGKSIYEQKIEQLKKEFSKYDKKEKLVIYCWRGGLRSQTVTNLASDCGFNAAKLDGGYKEYRKYIREQLYSFKPKFIFLVLRGLAGCGKTDIIKKIQPSIDLEGYAKHRGSLFGAIGLKPATQKQFETKLFQILTEFKNEKYVFVEGESQKIGNLFIPKNIFEAMNNGKTIIVNRTIKNRSKKIVDDYFVHNEDKKIIDIIKSLNAALTNSVTKNLTKLMINKDYLEVSRILLEDYYDPKYMHMIEQFKINKEVNSDNVKECIKELNSFAKHI